MIPTENSPIPDLNPLIIPLVTTSTRPEETFYLGRRLARLLERGSIVALRGPLAAGKTCFVKGIAVGLGIKEEVTSPTYNIISEYQGIISDENFPLDSCDMQPGDLKSNGMKSHRIPVPVYHIDAYRLNGDDDLSAIGGVEIIFGKGISLVEWSERIPGFIPAWAIKVDFEITGANERRISIYRK